MNTLAMNSTSGCPNLIRADGQMDDWPTGSHLVSPRRFYLHHGIYLGGGEVVHYSGFSSSFRAGPVEVIDLERRQLLAQSQGRIPPPLVLMFSMAEGTVKIHVTAILKALGVGKMRLLSSPKKYHALGGFGLEVVEYVGE